MAPPTEATPPPRSRCRLRVLDPEGLRVGSLFSGVGGLDLGLEHAGMRVAWQVEVDRRCRSVLARHWPEVSRFDDVQEVSSDDLPGVDLVIGGFPCQDLSMAGRRAGLGGARSGLWWEFHRLVAGLRPRWLVVENVPGLLSSGGGRDMGAVLGSLADLGYGFAWRVLDARYFGLAQRRRRLFIVGLAGADGAGAAEVLLEPESRAGSPRSCGEARQATPAAGRRRAPAGRGPLRLAGGTNIGLDVGGTPRELIAATLQTHTDWLNDTLVPVGVQGNSRGEVRLGPVIGTLTTTRSTTQFNDVITLAGIRRLLPVERERLQGLPDHWTRWGADGVEMPTTVRERMTGNAVAVPVAAWIGRRMRAAEGGDRR